MNKYFDITWHLLRIAALGCVTALAVTAGGCAARDAEGITPEWGSDPDGMHLRLSLEPGGYTRALPVADYDVTAAEQRIDDVLVMLFSQGRDLKPYTLVAAKIAELQSDGPSEGASRRFDVRFSYSEASDFPEKMRLVAIANGARLADKLSEIKGKSYAEILAREDLWRSENGDNADEAAPLFTMWGCSQDEVSQGIRIQNIRISLLRDMAKVSVTLANDDEGNVSVTGDSGFRLAHALVYNRRGEVAMLPSLDAMDTSDSSGTGLDPYGLKAPTVKTGSDGKTLMTGLLKDEGYADAVLTEGVKKLSLYVAEQDVLMGGTASVDDDNAFNRPALIVGGYNGGDTGKLTWYRVDFTGGKDAEGNPVLADILRNHHYRVRVKAVNGPGEETPELAYSTLQTKVEAEIVDWKDVEWDAEFDGSNWIAAQREVTVGALKDDTGEVILRSNVESSTWIFTWDDEGKKLFEFAIEPVESEEIGESEESEDFDKSDSFDQSYQSDPSDNTERTRVVITALEDLPLGVESRSAVLTVTVTPRLRFVINVVQSVVSNKGDSNHDDWRDEGIYWIL